MKQPLQFLTSMFWKKEKPELLHWAKDLVAVHQEEL